MDPFTLSTAVAGGLSLVKEVTTGLKSAQDTARDASKYVKNGSLIDIAKVARVEPILIVDADCMNVEGLSDVTQAMQSLFAGYYLQAVNLLGTIGGVSVASKLAPLNPNRGIGFEDHKDWRIASESYKHRLPTTHNILAMEAEKDKLDKQDVEPKAGIEVDKESFATLKEQTNLSTGKLYNVKIVEGALSAVVPIAIRVMVSMLPTASVVNMFTFKDSYDMDMKERYHAWRSGRLELINDLIFCRDIVEKHRTAIIKDKTGIYSTIIGRENNNRAAGLLNRNPSLATASNLAIISSDTVAQMELKLGGRITNFKVRSALFENTNLMILAVVDKSWERVTFYHRGIQETTSATLRELKSSNKGGGSEVLDIMKAYIAGSNPAI